MNKEGSRRETKENIKSYFKDIDISKIITNPLLTITENKIHFKYEDIKNGN
jgi:hypothetical protein